MAEWLGDTPIFQATMTSEERAEFALFKTKVQAIDTKETDMAKNNDVQTTINETVNTESKEDTMTENVNVTATANESKEDTMTTTQLPKTFEEYQMAFAGMPMKARKNGTAYYDRTADVARHLTIRKETKLARIKGIEPATCIPGETVGNITKDPAEVELLGKACKKFGWENGVCTVSKAGKYHGTPNPEYEGHGWFVRFKDAKTETSGTVAYPMEAFIWDTESGLPEFDAEKKAAADARKAKIAANKAAKQLREANKAAGIKTPRRKTSRKPAAKKVETIANEPMPMAAPGADMAAMMNMLNAVMAQNAQLIAALAAKSE